MKKNASKKTYRFVSVLEQSDNKLWGAHFRVPGDITRSLGGKDRRVVCTLNGSHRRQCAMLSHGNGSFVITVNKGLRTSLGLDFGDEVDVVLMKDKSTYGLPLPVELAELLRQDKEGNAFFRTLTPGRKRTLLHIVGSVKDPEKRLARSLVIVNHLRKNRGEINYKQLYGMLKDRPRAPKTKSPA